MTHRKLALFLTFCICIHGLEARATEPQRSEKNQKEIVSNQKPAQTGSSPQTIAANYQPSQPDANTKEQQYDPRSDRLYRAYLLATVIGVLGGIAGIIVLIIQTVATRRAAKAAKASADIAVESQRSWLLCIGVAGPEVTHDWIKHIEFRFSVLGNAPVKVIEAGFRFHLVGSRPAASPHAAKGHTEPDLPELPDYGERYTVQDIPQMGHVLKPTEEFSVHPRLEGMFFKEGDIAAINKWEKFVCAYGFIKYRDAFNKSKIRETRFCFIYNVVRPLSQLPVREPKNEFIVGGPSAYNDVT